MRIERLDVRGVAVGDLGHGRTEAVDGCRERLSSAPVAVIERTPHSSRPALANNKYAAECRPSCNSPLQGQIGQLCCPLPARAPRRPQPTGNRLVGRRATRSSQSGVICRKVPPRPMLQCNPRPIRKIRGTLRRTGGGEGHGAAAFGSARYWARFRRALAWSREGGGARAGGCPRWQAHASRKAEAMTLETKPTMSARQPDAALSSSRARAGCSTRAASTTPAASASSPTSRARNRTSWSRTRSPSWRTSSIAAPWAPIPIAGDGAGILIQIPHEFLARGMRAARASSCRSPATMPSAISSCRRTSGCARTASACGCASSARRAWSSWAGARCRSTTPACPRWSRRWSRCTGRSSSAGRRR